MTASTTSASPPASRVRPWRLGLALLLVIAAQFAARYAVARLGWQAGAVSAETWPILADRRHYSSPPDLLAAALGSLPPLALLGTLGLALRARLRRRIGPATYVGLLFLLVIAINITVAMCDGGWSAVTRPFSAKWAEYYGGVSRVETIRQFLHDYNDIQPTLPLHASTHPPGGVLFLYGVKQLFGPSLLAAALTTIMVTATGIVPAYLLARRAAGADAADISAALYAVTPSLVLFGATSIDGIITVLLVWAFFLFYSALARRPFLFGAAAGLALAAGALMTFVTVVAGFLLLLLATFEFLRGRTLRALLPPLLACGGILIACLAGLYLWSGFNILDCLSTSEAQNVAVWGRHLYSFGQWVKTSPGNLAAFLVGCGLPTIILAVRQLLGPDQPPRNVRPLLLACAVTAVFFALAHLFMMETERVWMFLIPLSAIGAGALLADQRSTPAGRILTPLTIVLLFAQALGMQLLLTTIW